MAKKYYTILREYDNVLWVVGIYCTVDLRECLHRTHLNVNELLDNEATRKKYLKTVERKGMFIATFNRAWNYVAVGYHLWWNGIKMRWYFWSLLDAGETTIHHVIRPGGKRRCI
jgi:hypothetical protein